jgi:hypothetical protein
MRERHTTINFDAFGQYRVVVVVSSDINSAIEKRLDVLKERKTPQDLESCRAITYHLDDIKESIIFLRNNPSIADIVHECWHVVYRMFEYFGADLEDETVAYHLNYLCQQVYNFVRRR